MGKFRNSLSEAAKKEYWKRRRNIEKRIVGTDEKGKPKLEDHKRPLRGQGDLPILARMFVPNFSLGRKRDRADQFSRKGRHAANFAKRDAKGRFISPIDGKVMTAKEHGKYLRDLEAERKAAEEKAKKGAKKSKKKEAKK